ncbi:beta-lactamase family protein [Streptomyces sp. NBC_00144]|uniref:serine hydrolase domain-containing protein n=1 Tax=Streptomyces sp. NBC_00144 TaxID=2975665 RepID=UPI003252DE75
MSRTTPPRRLTSVLLIATGLLSLAATPVQAVRPVSGPRPSVVTAGRGHCPSGSLNPRTVAALDKAVKHVQQETGVPGVITGVWLPSRGSYVRAFGTANEATGAPMDPGLRMRIGSETKTFTVTALLQLVDDGKVGLDDPISDYVSGVPDGEHITLRQLAEMRSGLYNYTEAPEFLDELYAHPERQWKPKETLAIAFSHPSQFPPGGEFEYSNTNTVLLGLVVEKVTRQPLADVIRDRITGPSHLRHTVLPKAAEFPKPHSHGYTQVPPAGETVDATNWNPSWAWAAGAMTSDLSDLRAWAPDLATGTLLKPQTQAERLHTLPTGIPSLTYGLGIFNVTGWIGHNGTLPGYESLTVYLPAQRATMVVLVNTDTLPPGVTDLTAEFAKAITGIVTPSHVYGDVPAME